jgi:hypothetical protein
MVLPPRGRGSGLQRVLGGAICEWISAPPAIALVAKSWGVSAHQLAGGESPVTGRCYKDVPFFAPRSSPTPTL